MLQNVIIFHCDSRLLIKHDSIILKQHNKAPWYHASEFLAAYLPSCPMLTLPTRTWVLLGRSLADGSPAQAHYHGVQSWKTQLGMPVSPTLQARKCHAQSLLVISVISVGSSWRASARKFQWTAMSRNHWQHDCIEPKVKGISFLGENKRCNHLERQWKFLILNDF